MNKTAIITGASTGIGKAIAQYFIEKKFNVVMNSSNESNLKTCFDELGAPENAIYIVGDIGERETGKMLVKEALNHFGTIDVLINNAGIFQPKPFLEVSEEDLDRHWSVNLKGTFFTSQAVIPSMIQNGGGSIVNMGTVLVDHAIANGPSTAPITSKAAIHAFTRHLAAEFGKHNIRVNTIAPGVIRTPLLRKNGIADPDILAGLHLLNKIGEPRAIAEAAYYLATSDFITGETLNVDGGQSAGHFANF
jgi:NAD(P)-dependent dehydrogenase (short-subunit alcohol dehydrogenase family)